MDTTCLFVFLAIFALTSAEIKYFLYNSNESAIKVVLNESNLNLIDKKSPVKFIVHGWMESADRLYFREMTDAYLIRGNVNVVQVDWKGPAAQLYFTSSMSTKTIGTHLGNTIAKLNKEHGVPLMNIHVIGHSLGAHVAGFAGKEVIQQTGQKIARISGLDPAGPGFSMNTKAERLNEDDAITVDVTHTDAGFFGYEMQMGTVDFYPNGGQRPQPGCEPFTAEIMSLDPLQIPFCSHTRSYHFFIESINSKGFLATKCRSYDSYVAGHCSKEDKIVYGEDMPLNANGTYYFTTNPTKPYEIKME